MHDDDLEGSPDTPALGVWQLVGLGTVFAGTVVAGLVLGWLVDRHFDSSPIFVLAGIGIGIVAAFASAWRQIKPFLSE